MLWPDVNREAKEPRSQEGKTQGDRGDSESQDRHMAAGLSGSQGRNSLDRFQRRSGRGEGGSPANLNHATGGRPPAEEVTPTVASGLWQLPERTSSNLQLRK